MFGSHLPDTHGVQVTATSFTEEEDGITGDGKLDRKEVLIPTDKSRD